MRLARDSTLYVNDAAGVRVFSGRLEGSDTAIAIKEQIHPSLARANSAIKEGFTMVQVKHPYIVKVYSCEIEETPPKGYKTIIAMELMESDLFKRIEWRKRHQQWWGEAQLMEILVKLVQALSYAQQMGISHRDIKPQNIFVSSDETMVKVGDFGSVCSETTDGFGQRATLTGSPLFLSPQLKNSYITMSQNRPGQVSYNPYKSDVYSLGVTFIYMALLDSPTGLTDLENIHQNTEILLRRLDGYSTLQWFLREMLVIEEESRVDFVTLEQQMVQCGMCNGAGGQTAVVSEPQYQQEQVYAPEYYQQYSQGTQGYEQAQAAYSIPAEQYTPQHPQPVDSAYYPNPEPYPIPEESKSQPSYPAETPTLGPNPTDRKCHGCFGPMINSLSPENYDPKDREWVLNCCSEQCLQKVLHPPPLRPEELVTCVKCQVNLGEKSIKMNCGHSFCNDDCVFGYIRYISEDFKLFLKEIPCPKCPMNREEYLPFLRKSFISRDDFEKRKDNVKKLSCVVCRTKEDLLLWKCGHKFCSNHYHSCKYCPICDKRPNRHSYRHT